MDTRQHSSSNLGKGRGNIEVLGMWRSGWTFFTCSKIISEMVAISGCQTGSRLFTMTRSESAFSLAILSIRRGFANPKLSVTAWLEAMSLGISQLFSRCLQIVSKELGIFFKQFAALLLKMSSEAVVAAAPALQAALAVTYRKTRVWIRDACKGRNYCTMNI